MYIMCPCCFKPFTFLGNCGYTDRNYSSDRKFSREFRPNAVLTDTIIGDALAYALDYDIEKYANEIEEAKTASYDYLLVHPEDIYPDSINTFIPFYVGDCENPSYSDVDILTGPDGGIPFYYGCRYCKYSTSYVDK